MMPTRLKHTVILLLLLFPSLASNSQELLVNVSVDSRQIQGADRTVFETMKRAIYEFLNNRRWTGFQLEVNEKIECSMLLVIEERNMGTNEFSGRLNVSLRRPVFNSSYTTILFNYVDKDVKFKYIENEPLDFDQNNYTSDLTSLLAFYAYIMIGLDFDSFTPGGGAEYYQIAQDVVNAAQNSIYPGWKSFDSQNSRFWMVENLMNSSYRPLHSFLYEYHLKGLDVMHKDVEEGRRAIKQSLEYLRQVKRDRPGLFLLQIILEAKRDEIINIFSEGTSSEKNEVAEMMIEIDPSHTSEYRRITAN